MIVVISLSVWALTACAPTQQELANADYGLYPKNYEQIIKNNLNSTLKDPDSAKIDFLGDPQKFYHFRKYGYATCINLNAKNSYGGYSGYEKVYFFIRDNVVLHVIEEQHPQYATAKAEDLCGSLVLKK